MVGQPIAAQVREGQAMSQNSLLHLRIKAHKNKGIPAPGILNVTRWKYIKMDILDFIWSWGWLYKQNGIIIGELGECHLSY